jgi:3-oxoacyl-[acyl-carrier protein] reductase
MFALTGKTALVTGASGDIGAAIATLLQRQGARLALAGTRRAPLDALAARLGPDSVVLTADLGDPVAVETLARDAEQALGSLDILVNNAGLTKDGLVLRMKDEDWNRVLDVNLTAAFRLARAALRGMMKRRFGRVINITSIVGVTGNPGQVNYAASKAGLIGFSKSLAQEVASRGITEALSPEQKTRLMAGIPLGRMGQPDEIAAAAVYLASSEAAYVTGQTLHVNGGMAMI